MRKTTLKWMAGALAVTAAGVLLDSLFLEKYFFKIKAYKIGNLGSTESFRLILLTDMHLKNRLYVYHHKLARTINQFQPDLILFAGDTLDTDGLVAPADEFLGLLSPQVPKVAIAGNHDYLATDSLQALQQAFQKHNGELLFNDSKLYDLPKGRLLVTGLNDFIESESSIDVALLNVDAEAHHVLLLHSPLQQEKAMKKLQEINKKRPADNQVKINYIFAGHNHGGQVRLPGFVPVLPKKSGGYVEGWYNNSAPFLYLSRGFGTSTLPVRFFTRSEVVLFQYHI